MPQVRSGCRQPVGSSTPWPQVRLPLSPSSSTLDDSNLDEGPTRGGNQNRPRQQACLVYALARAASTVQPVKIAINFDACRGSTLGKLRTGIGGEQTETAKFPVESPVDLWTLPAKPLRPVPTAF